MTNQSSIEKGSIQANVLLGDLQMMASEINKIFPENSAEIEPYEDDETGDVVYIVLNNLPLPRSYGDDAKEQVLVVTNRYPQEPPRGFFIPSTSLHLGKMEEKLAVMDKAAYRQEEVMYKELEEKGWFWICYKYASHQWQFNVLDQSTGDNLTKYLFTLYGEMGA